MKVAIACGGPSSEHNVSIASVTSILRHIDRSTYDVSVFYITRDLQTLSFTPGEEFHIPDKHVLYTPLLEGIEKHLKRCDLVLLAGIHGEFVEDGRLQGILDMFKIPYTGSGAAASSLAMDKYRSSLLIKELVKNIKLPQTTLIDISKDIDSDSLTYPVVCKPNYMGSSVGVSIIKDSAEMEIYISTLRDIHHQQYMVVQEYIQNAVEVSCGCLEDKKGMFTLLPPIEIRPQKNSFFDYDSKYEKGGSIEISPPENISNDMAHRISKMTTEIHRALGCKTYSRSDFFVKGEDVIYLETNTLPGMTETSLLPKEAQAAGVSFTELLDRLIEASI